MSVNVERGVIRTPRLRAALGVALLVLLTGGCAPGLPGAELGTAGLATRGNFAPPVAEQRAQVVRSPHGDREDPYHWLRDDSRSDPTVLAYLQAEHAYYRQYVDRYKRQTDTLAFELMGRTRPDDTTSLPHVDQGYEYYVRYEPGSSYPIWVRKPKGGGNEQVVLDVNELAQGHAYHALGQWEVSPDGHLVAYAEDVTGGEEYTVRVRDLRTGANLSDVIHRAGTFAWGADSRRLFYVERNAQTQSPDRLKRRVLGQGAELPCYRNNWWDACPPSGSDPVLYEETEPGVSLGILTTSDKSHLMMVRESFTWSEVRVMKRDDPQERFNVLVLRQPESMYTPDHLNGRWIIRASEPQAPNGHVLAAADNQLGNRSAWQTLVPHDPVVQIESVSLFKSHLVLDESSEGSKRVRVLPWANLSDARTITAEASAHEIVSMGVYDWADDSPWLRYHYSSLSNPGGTYEFNMQTGERRPLKLDEPLFFQPKDYVSERVWVTARDGARVPVSLLHRKDVKRDGTAPLLQYAYGQYGLSQTAGFTPLPLPLVDRGFVYAIAHVRGGGEMGRQWHDAGKLLKKMNTFHDFIDVTSYLVEQGYAAPDKVFAFGGSAGGTLMGAVANIAPEKYRGIVALVPSVDVLNTQLDTSQDTNIAHFEELGDPRQKVFYDYILGYSPYDQVKKQAYPAMLVTTGLHDPRVGYHEAAKWVAKLRAHKTDNNPLLLSVNFDSGHFGSSDAADAGREFAEMMSFCLSLLGPGTSPGGSPPVTAAR